MDDLWICRTCYYADVCRAGCTWTAHCTLGKGQQPYCIHRASTYEERGFHEHLQELAPGQPFDHGVFGLELHDIPALEGETTILGHSLERVINLDWREESIWTEEELRAFVKKAPKVYQILEAGAQAPA